MLSRDKDRGQSRRIPVGSRRIRQLAGCLIFNAVMHDVNARAKIRTIETTQKFGDRDRGVAGFRHLVINQITDAKDGADTGVP